jgi:hypothetical protein
LQPFEYLLLFAVIVLGLAIGDLAASTQRLIAAGKLVRWDWLAPLAGVLAFLMTVTQWWNWFGEERIAGGLTFPMFLGVLVAAMLLFLLCATALPDDFGETQVDLRQYYGSISRRFWLLFLAHWAATTGGVIWAWITIGRADVSQIHPAWLTMPVALPLVFVENRWWHGLSMAVLVALYVGPHVGQTLAH